MARMHMRILWNNAMCKSSSLRSVYQTINLRGVRHPREQKQRRNILFTVPAISIFGDFCNGIGHKRHVMQLKHENEKKRDRLYMCTCLIVPLKLGFMFVPARLFSFCEPCAAECKIVPLHRCVGSSFRDFVAV
jgi:hypothetical protein